MSAFRVAAWQGPNAQSVGETLRIAREADAAGADVVVFPECFLTGYYADRERAAESALTLDGPEMTRLCAESAGIGATMIVGFNERRGDELFNSAAVIEGGRCRGVYRKSYLYYGYHTPGREYPVFERDGVTFGIVICLDVFYLEPARILARRGAKLIFCPMDNRVPPDHKYATRPAYYSHFVARTFENDVWLVSADVVEPFAGGTVCPGHSAVYDPDGREVARSVELAEALLIYDIPRASLARKRPVKLHGDAGVVSVYAESER